MPFLAILIILIGVWVLINTLNGNLIDVVEGKSVFFWQNTSPSVTTTSQEQPLALSSSQATGGSGRSLVQ